MKAFEEHWNKEIRPYIHNPSDRELAKYWWREALKWARVKVENYTPEDVCYFIDEELEQ